MAAINFIKKRSSVKFILCFLAPSLLFSMEKTEMDYLIESKNNLSAILLQKGYYKDVVAQTELVSFPKEDASKEEMSSFGQYAVKEKKAVVKGRKEPDYVDEEEHRKFVIDCYDFLSGYTGLHFAAKGNTAMFFEVDKNDAAKLSKRVFSNAEIKESLDSFIFDKEICSALVREMKKSKRPSWQVAEDELISRLLKIQEKTKKDAELFIYKEKEKRIFGGNL